MKPFIVLDVGCRDQPLPRWFRLPGLKVIGWDPDGEEIARLQRKYPQFTYIACALGSYEGQSIVYRTVSPDCDSLLSPLPDSHLKDWVFKPANKSYETSVHPLDSFCNHYSDGADLLKIDTQGSELEVLMGAAETLKSVLMVEVETEFNPFYEGQGLFGDVDKFLRSQGFEFYDFQEMNRYSKRFGHTCNLSNQGQLNWAESFYIPKPLRDPERTKILAEACDFPNFGE